MPDINQYTAGTGRRIKEDNSIINLADKIDEIHKALVLNKDAGVQLTGSNVIQPSDIQSHYQQTIQTHNAVSVALSGNSLGVWIDTDGFSDLALNFLNDANTANHVDIQWSFDGATIHSLETPLTNIARQYGAISIQTKARYARVKVYNDDAALAHTMSAWAYLKA